MPDMLEDMTQAKWDSMPLFEREKIRDYSGLTPQLRGYEGDRVEVIDRHGNRRRFWVGRSTGWRPCHLEILRRNSMGGGPADRDYQSVVLIRRGPR